MSGHSAESDRGRSGEFVRLETAEKYLARALSAEDALSRVATVLNEWGMSSTDAAIDGDVCFAEAIEDSGAWRLARDLRAALTRVTPPEPTEVWECGPHANAWNGHDARCRRITPPGSGRDS